jgi:hypothetical protein
VAEGLVSQPVQLPNGNLVIPQRVTAADGTIGDRFVEIAPDHPDYKEWLKFVK